MSLHDEKAAALAEVLAATGEEIVWEGRTLHALVSDNPLSQDLGLGVFDAAKRSETACRRQPERQRWRAAPEGRGGGGE